MEYKKEFKKHIQNLSKDFAQENNFMLYKRTCLIRIVNDIMHIISFDFPPSGMQCYIAIQPLYIPEENIHFSFGERLNFFNSKVPGLWGIEKDRMKDDIMEIDHLLHENALSWFEKILSPIDLIDFINGQSFHIIKCTPFLKNLYLGFSYLMIKKYELALNPLVTALDLTRDFIGIYKEKNKNLISNILCKIQKQEFTSIEDCLNSYIQLTKESCKISEI